jgi:nucleotide-binding universal stress UspA family protein
VSAWNPSYDIDALGLATRTVEDHCRAVLDAAQDEVTDADPSIEVTSTSYIGPAATALVRASREADTLVVGSRGLRAVPAFLLGATSLEVAAHAACPVVVVGASSRATTSGGVVVGVDGTPRASEAIAYAFAYASAHDIELTVLHAFQVEYIAGVISELAAEESNARVAQEELALTAEVVAGWQEKYPDVHVTTVTMRNHPVDALVEASTTASLLVIGGRRRGLGGALLGSVGHGTLHDAHCPVAVVRAHAPVGQEL